MSAINSPIDVAQLVPAGSVVYPDDPNGTGYPVGDYNFYPSGSAVGVFADFAPRLDGNSPAALDNILRLLLRTNKFHLKVNYHGIETTGGNSVYTSGSPIPYTWEDDLVFQPALPGHSEANCYQCASSGIVRRNATATPGVADNGGNFSGDGYTYLIFKLLSNGAASDGNLPLFLTFALQCYPVVTNPYGGPSTAFYVEAVGNLTAPALKPNSITLAGQMFNACAIGAVAGPASGTVGGVPTFQNFYFDSLELTETGSWSWDGLYD